MLPLTTFKGLNMQNAFTTQKDNQGYQSKLALWGSDIMSSHNPLCAFAKPVNREGGTSG